MHSEGNSPISYLTCIYMFDRLADIKRDLKTGAYLEYLCSLRSYMSNILDRIHPLLSIEKEVMKVRVSFEKGAAEQFKGWEKETVPGSTMIKPIDINIDLHQFSSEQELK